MTAKKDDKDKDAAGNPKVPAVNPDAPASEAASVLTDSKGHVQQNEKGEALTVEKGVSEEKADEAKERADSAPGNQDADASVNVNMNPDRSHPTILKSAQDKPKADRPEDMERRAKGEEAQFVDRSSERARQEFKATPSNQPVYVMTNINNEKLNVTRQQWEKYGQRLMANGWLEPLWAKELNVRAGNEPIPPDVDWGKDK